MPIFKSILIISSISVLLSGCGGSSNTKPSSDSPVVVQPVLTPSTPVTAPSTPVTITNNASQIGLSSWRNAGYTGKGVNIAVLDTGMPVPDITDRNITFATNLQYTSDFTNDAINKTSDTSFDNGPHGNDMSQVIGSSIYGAAPDVNIMDGVIADTTGTTNRSSMIKGIGWAVSHNANIINLSFGYGALVSYTGTVNSNIESTFNAIKANLVSSGVAIVHSAGNDSQSVTANLYTAPSYSDWVKTDAKSHILIVGATYDNKNLAYFSNYAGTDADVQSRFVVAPAQSAVDTGSTIGTSGAAANVSGALALMKQRWMSLTGPQLEQIILDTANKSFSGYDPAIFGQGVVDMAAAFSPVGLTSVPVSSTASVPLSAISFSLPKGFQSVQASTAFVDKYNRDFTLTVQSKEYPYVSPVFGVMNGFLNETNTNAAPVINHLAMGFSGAYKLDANNALSQNGLMGLKTSYGSNVDANLNSAYLAGNFSGMGFRVSTTLPTYSAKTTNVSQQGFSSALSFKGLSINPYYLQTNGVKDFYNAGAKSLTGLSVNYATGNGLFVGMNHSTQEQPGSALVKNYRIDSNKYYVGFLSNPRDTLRFNIAGYIQKDAANIHVWHPSSVGNGSLYYQNETLHSYRDLHGVTASIGYKGLMASFASNELDNCGFLGFKRRF